MVDVRRVIIYVLILVLRSRMSRSRSELLRRMQAARESRLVAFRRLQAKQRLLYAILLSVVAFEYTSTVQRSIWVQERSNVWWDRIVNQCFDDCHWLENFRI